MTASIRGTTGGRPPGRRWRGLLTAAVLAAASAYGLVLMEWLFFVTKPSMFTPMGWPSRLAVLFAAGLPAALAAALAAALLATPAAALTPRSGEERQKPAPRAAPQAWASIVAVLVPAALLALTVLLLVENFTKTAFDFNVGSFTSPVRYLYAAGLLLLTVLFGRRLHRVAVGRVAVAAMAALLLVSALAAAVRYRPPAEGAPMATGAAAREVNVLLLSSDGIEARRMSVYGAERRTTPFLESKVGELLVSENHFTNAATTAGSNGALLTGKLPITTGLTQAGDAFAGEHVHRHLPGVLRQLGYHNIEIGLRHNADAFDHNLRRGFHVANGRTLMVAPLPLAGWFADSFPSEQYFLGLTQERVSERLAHAFGAADMQDTFAIVTGKWQRIPDENRMTQLFAELERAPRPFFAQVHLMGTHGERFDPRQRLFSAGKEQRRKWDPDFLDDAILDFDGHVAEVMRFLEERGELERTLLVLNSDHGMKWATGERLPLLFRFPGAEPRGTIVPNTQRIDIAPTVLAYLGVEPPAWMEGDSLLGPEPDRLRPILSTGFLRKGPFLPWLSLVQCQSFSELDLDTGDLDQSTVAGHTDPCAEEELFTREETRQYLLERLGGSAELPEPLFLGERLERLRDASDPEERRRLAEAIVAGTVVRGLARALDEEISVARVHWDLWTRGTSSAGLVVRNRGSRELSRRLVVTSGREREFPVPFHVQDGETTYDYVFEGPGSMEIELAPVPPRSSRLFILWSDRAFAAGKRRALGVQLSLSLSDRLERLRDSGDRDAWQSMASDLLTRQLPVRELGRGLRAINLHFDGWTRGTQPAALALRNRRPEPRSVRLAVETGGGGDFPMRVFVADGESTREHLFEVPGRRVIELPEVPPTSEALFLIWSDRAWTPGERDRRRLGVQLTPE